MGYTAKITEAREEFFLSENKPFMDIWFDILLDGNKVAERRLAYPMGTDQSVIEADIKRYCQMFQDDLASSEKAGKLMEAKAESQKAFDNLKGTEIA